MRHAVLLALAAATLPFAGCGDSDKPPAAGAPLAAADTRFPLSIGGRPLRVRLALTELEQAAGLMGTSSLPAGEGMVFAYRDADSRAFWMANVPYDIDLGYFDAEGKLDETLRLRANDTTPVRSRSDAIRYVVEAPAGWFAGQGLRPGAALDLNELAAGIRARGFAEKAFVPSAR